MKAPAIYGSFSQSEWDELTRRYPPGTPVAGTILSRHPFGVFVEWDAEPTVKVLLEIIHFSVIESDADRPVVFPDDYPDVGDRIDARVLAWCARPVDVRLTQLSPLKLIHRDYIRENSD